MHEYIANKYDAKLWKTTQELIVEKFLKISKVNSCLTSKDIFHSYEKYE